MKMPKNATGTARNDGIGSILACVTFFVSLRCLFCFFICIGNWPLYCRFARAVLWEGEDKYVDQCDAG